MSNDHVLVCLSSSPANERIIRSAADMASAFGAKFTALYVEKRDVDLSREDMLRLEEHMELAKKLNARIERVYGEDIAYQIAEFARLRGVTKIVIGRSTSFGQKLFRRKGLTDRLLYYAPKLEIHIIPDSTIQSDYRISRKKYQASLSIKDILKSIALLCTASLIGLMLEHVGMTAVSILPVYILAVLITAIMTNGYAYWLLASFAAVFSYNFLFTAPRYTLLAYDADYPITFLIMFIVSVIAGNLTTRLKHAAQDASQTAHRTKLIFDTDQLLARISEPDRIIETTAGQIAGLTAKDVVYYMNQGDMPGEPHVIRGINSDHSIDFNAPEELEAAQYTFKYRHISGSFSNSVPNAKARYYAVRMNDAVYGVIGTEVDGHVPDAYENSILISILGECALAMENARNASEKEEAKLRARNEQTRADMLRAISHDIRTPLTTIAGNADSLLRYDCPEDDRKRIYADIYDDSIWLKNLVENLLVISKIDDEHISLNMTVELMEDVIAEAIDHVDRYSCNHDIKIMNDGNSAVVRMDAHLIVQVIVNLVSNAIKYTPEGSEICIVSNVEDDFVHVEIRDNGPGFDENDIEHVFDRFYTGKKRSSDSRRGLGLGLALCRSIVEIHGGTIKAERNDTGGASVHFSLPLEKVGEHE